MTGKKEFRPHSNASRLWVAVEELWPPFCNQMVIEGNGSIDHSALLKAVESASGANPGSRLILSGMSCRKKWIDSGSTPPVRIIDGSQWSGYNMEGAPFLNDRLNISSGPSCEILSVSGNKTRLIIRTHHAVMDGRGTMTWAEDIFRALRGEKTEGAEYITTEDDLLNLRSRTEKPIPERYISPAGKPGTGDGFAWFRKKIDGKFTDIVPSVMMLIASEAWRHGEGKIRIAIPVDLRSRKKNLRSTGNLTNAVFFNLDKNTTKNSLKHDLQKRINEQNDGVLTWEDHILKYIPRFILKTALKSEAAGSEKTGLYRCSTTISNLGRIPLDLFTTATFTAESVFFIPPGNNLSPFFITLQGNSAGIEIVLTVPSCYNLNGTAEDFLNRLGDGLKADAGAIHDS